MTDIADILATKHLTFGQLKDELASAEFQLLKRPEVRRRFGLNELWTCLFENQPGVYTIFVDDLFVYVGETGNLKGRMRDLRQTRNHTFRRSLGETLFHTRPGFEFATKKKNFPDHIEKELDAYMCEHIFVASIHVVFGRMEIEESLIQNHKPSFNVKGQRKTR
jgi:hypothetical protein